MSNAIAYNAALAIDYSAGDQNLMAAGAGGPSRALYISTAGTLKVTMANGTAAVFVGLLAGNVYPIAAKLIWQTGSTTAAGLVLR